MTDLMLAAVYAEYCLFCMQFMLTVVMLKYIMLSVVVSNYNMYLTAFYFINII